MKKIVPSLWFGDNNCEEAIQYYVSVFPNSEILHIERYPDENLNEHFKEMSVVDPLYGFCHALINHCILHNSNVK